jgi:exodeoxyribonuclease VII small subunit
MDTLSFEEAFEQLSAIIVALQDGKLPLERALQQYQDGMKLAHHCHQLLQQAELTIQQLTANEGGDLSTIPLDI